MGRVRVYGGWGNDLIDLRASTVGRQRPERRAGAEPRTAARLRHARLGGARVRRRRPGHLLRRHRRRPADRLGRQPQQLLRAVLAVRHADRQPHAAAVPARVPLRTVEERRRRPDARLGDRSARAAVDDAACSDSRLQGRAATASRSASSASCCSTTRPGTSRPGRRSTRCPRTSAASAIDIAEDGERPAVQLARDVRLPGASSACSATASLSLPSGAGVNLPSGTNTPGASSVPLVVTGTPGATVTYTFTRGHARPSPARGVIGPRGTFGASRRPLRLRRRDDHGHGHADLGREDDDAHRRRWARTASRRPRRRCRRARSRTSRTASAYNVTVTGQVGAIANVVISDGATPIANYANGMDFVGSNGSVVDPGRRHRPASTGRSRSRSRSRTAPATRAATTLTVTKDTVAAGRSRSRRRRRSTSRTSTSFPFVDQRRGRTQRQLLVHRRHDDALEQLERSRGTASGASTRTLTSLKDGTMTLTVTETDAEGNQTVQHDQPVKETVAPAAPTVALNPLDDSGISNSDYVTSVTSAALHRHRGAGTTTTVYVNGVVYTGQKLADGTYTVTAIADRRRTATSRRRRRRRSTLVIDTTPPSGSFSIAGAKTINGQLAGRARARRSQLSLSGDRQQHVRRCRSRPTAASTFSTPVAYAASATHRSAGRERRLHGGRPRHRRRRQQRDVQPDRPARHGRPDDRATTSPRRRTTARTTSAPTRRSPTARATSTASRRSPRRSTRRQRSRAAARSTSTRSPPAPTRS